MLGGISLWPPATDPVENRHFQYLSCSRDFVLIDSFDKNIGGGTGKKFNWNIVKDFLGINGIFLAGGLNSNNINSAMKLMPWGIDISTGVETDGEKDNNKISEFISMVKNYAK